MSLVSLEINCPKCTDVDNVIATYNEENNDMVCRCLNCESIGSLSSFTYLIYND